MISAGVAFFVQREPQPLLARFGNYGPKALSLEVVMQAFGDVRIVLDDQDSFAAYLLFPIINFTLY